MALFLCMGCQGHLRGSPLDSLLFKSGSQSNKRPLTEVAILLVFSAAVLDTVRVRNCARDIASLESIGTKNEGGCRIAIVCQC